MYLYVYTACTFARGTRVHVTVTSCWLFTHRTRTLSGDSRHTVRVATPRDEVLHHHRAAHRLHGRSISGERTMNNKNRLPGRFFPKRRSFIHAFYMNLIIYYSTLLQTLYINLYVTYVYDHSITISQQL